MSRNLPKKKRRSPHFVSQSTWHQEIKSVSDVTPEYLQYFWLGSDDILIDSYALAVAACLVLAHREADRGHIEMVIDSGLSSAIKDGCTEAHEILAGVAAYSKSEKLWERLREEIERSGPHGFLVQINVWAHIQRSLVAKGALNPDDAKVLENVLALACYPDGSSIPKSIATALDIVRDGPQVIEQVPVGRGCALSAFFVVTGIAMLPLVIFGVSG